MKLIWYTALLLGTAAFSSAQNCPILGPAYPAPTNVVAPSLAAAKAKFDEALKSSTRINRITSFYGVQIYSSSSKEPLYHSYHTPTGQNTSAKVGPDTLFRIHSISKVMAVYAILAKLSDKYWNEPVSKFIAELGGKPRDSIRDVDWSEITLGALAGQSSGISRDYALADGSTVYRALPGLRSLQDSEVVKCGSSGQKACNRKDAMQYVLQTWPYAQSSRTPNYSNMAFQLLAYAVENITGQPFRDLVHSQLVEPLKLKRTFLTLPNDTDAAIYDGWDLDFGDEAPTGGYYLSAGDLTAVGRSILSSTLLAPLTTRRWLSPIIHTGSMRFSIGRPWEIIRQSIPVTAGSEITRTVDFYTKQGGGDTYTSLLGLSPDHNMGISIVTAGPSSFATFDTIKQAFINIMLPAAEQAARDQAGVNFIGNYTLPDNSSATISFSPGEPALFLERLISNGTDILAFAGTARGAVPVGQPKMWLYPTGLATENRIAFRGFLGVEGKVKAEDCGSWAEGDRLRWGNYPADLVVFEVESDGKATAVEVPVLGRTLRRVKD